jgi:hypothetical protein
MQQSDIRFEIRKGVKLAHKHNAMIQAGYDTADRHANLLGHIPFGALLSEPLKEIVPEILPHIERVAGYGLIDDPAQVTELFERLVQYNGDESFASLVGRICDDDEFPFPNAARAAVYQLWHFHGIRLPEISPKHAIMEEVRQGIREVLQHAPDLSYRTIWEAALVKDLKTARIAVHRAADFHVINLPWPNGLCCSINMCVVGMSTDFCATSNGSCVAGSSFCTNAPAPGLAEECGCC